MSNDLSRRKVALVAHDRKKERLASWVRQWADILARHELVATETTGGVLCQNVSDLSITTTKSGPMGGDQQIGAMIAEGKIDLLIFFTDPLSPHPHDVDVKALTRLATVYDIPMACGPATADLIMRSGFLEDAISR